MSYVYYFLKLHINIPIFPHITQLFEHDEPPSPPSKRSHNAPTISVVCPTSIRHVPGSDTRAGLPTDRFLAGLPEFLIPQPAEGFASNRPYKIVILFF